MVQNMLLKTADALTARQGGTGQRPTLWNCKCSAVQSPGAALTMCTPCTEGAWRAEVTRGTHTASITTSSWAVTSPSELGFFVSKGTSLARIVNSVTKLSASAR